MQMINGNGNNGENQKTEHKLTDTFNNDDQNVPFTSIGSGKSYAIIPTDKQFEELTDDPKNYTYHWEWIKGWLVMIMTDIRDLSLSVLPRYLIQYRLPEHLIMTEVKDYQNEQASAPRNKKEVDLWKRINQGDIP